MKQEIPKPVIFGVAALAIALAAFLILRFTGGEPEFDRPKVEGGIPDYVKQKMSPEALQKLEKSGYDVKSEAKGGQPNRPVGAPTGKN
jgi:hypothetical protein